MTGSKVLLIMGVKWTKVSLLIRGLRGSALSGCPTPLLGVVLPFSLRPFTEAHRSNNAFQLLSHRFSLVILAF